jgi:competence protein ComEA
LSAPHPGGAPSSSPPTGSPADPAPASTARTPLADLAILVAVAALCIAPSWAGPARPAAPGGPLAAPSARPLKIDAARAPWYEWALLDGVGEARARRIVEARAALGGFRSSEDLDRVPGLSRGTGRRLSPFLVFPEGPPAGAAPAGDGTPVLR